MSMSKKDQVYEILRELFAKDARQRTEGNTSAVMETSSMVDAIARVLDLSVPSYRLGEMDSILLEEWGNADAATRRILALVASWAPTQIGRQHTPQRHLIKVGDPKPKGNVVIVRDGSQEAV
jgi:hypothetical protein